MAVINCVIHKMLPMPTNVLVHTGAAFLSLAHMATWMTSPLRTARPRVGPVQRRDCSINMQHIDMQDTVAKADWTG
jgi:hypothetical protein